ncbi:MAG: allophanate hydrolase, partial [Chloroflexi bacterium]|nr:allophanate hydrolase [Chloroflexota bacterium]
PLEIYDPQQRNQVFHDDPVLPKVGDRHKYVPIGEEEYWSIRREVEANSYVYQLKDDTFNLPQYLAEVGRDV